MTRGLLGRVLWQNVRPGQLVGAGAGALIGLFLLVATVQLFLDFRTVLTDRQEGLLGARYLVLNKAVGSDATVAGVLQALGDQDGSVLGDAARNLGRFLQGGSRGRPVFSDAEIAALRDLEPVEDVGAFVRSDFEMLLRGEIAGQMLRFSTLAFLDAVPDRFLDVPTDRWRWTPQDAEVPLVLPRMYADIYNFGFAASYGMPQLSRDTFSLVRFVMDVEGNGRRERFYGRIVGFTDRMTTPLAPRSFVEHANGVFGSGEDEGPSRVIIGVRDPSDPQLNTFLTRHGYETDREKLRESRLALILQSIAVSLGAIATVVILLSLLIFVLAFQLMITRTERDIRLLTDLGVPAAAITASYVSRFTASLVVLALVDAALFLLAKQQLAAVLAARGLELPGGVGAVALATAAAMVVIIAVANGLAIRRGVRRIAVKSLGS